MKNRKIESAIASILFILAIYLLFALINWTFVVSDWGGFSRFMLGFVGFIMILDLFAEL